MSITATLLTPIAQAQAQVTKKSNPTRKIRWKPPTPPNSLGTAINRGQGGGQRGCTPYQGITALVPVTDAKVAWGQTISDRPTLWLNTPKGLDKDLLIEIAVREENGKPIAKQLFTTTKTTAAGVISVLFPPAVALQTDRHYQWEIALYCDNADRVDRPLLIQGKIQRVATPSTILTQSPLTTAQSLAEAGIWYDAITQLGNGLRQQADPILSNAWSELLQSAGVVGSNQIQDCCQFDAVTSQHSASP